MALYAHTLPDRHEADWEPLEAHARAVAATAERAAAVFGWGGMARAIGLLHDAGKASAEFQAYIRGKGPSPDHSTWGARVAIERYGDGPGRMVALCVAGHHAGLPDPKRLDGRLDPSERKPDASRWSESVTAPARSALAPSRRGKPGQELAFSRAFLVRMLFSCLVDADFIETERFMTGGAVHRGVSQDMEVLKARFDTHMARVSAEATPTPLNRLRADILRHVRAKAVEAPGLFTLTVPTGGGKTLASLGFALDHAVRHGKRRVVVVIPFTSIIEQTAQVYRKVLGEEAVLEHHASFDWELAAKTARDGGDERDGLGLLRRAAENWDAPIVVTTAVQFFESLFANRTSACRKLHNLADSVIVLDEAQTLPTHLLRPCMAALDELARNYGASVVLCTATQPATRKQDGALVRMRSPFGLDIPEVRELALDPLALHDALIRTRAEVLPGPTTDEAIAARFARAPQMLCVVNSRRHAQDLFKLIADLPGAVHLTTLMVPAHRRQVLADLRTRLASGDPVRLVSTSLIEAGVDISFPEVWRAMAGIDQVNQAAGRCNREGEMLPDLGRVVVFTPAEAKSPRSLATREDAARVVLATHGDPLHPDAVLAYFRELYFKLEEAELDRHDVMTSLREGQDNFRFPYETIAKEFRLIDETMQPVVVPWNEHAKALLATVAHADKAPREALRRLQLYTVGIPKTARDAWLMAGEIVPVRRDLGAALLRFSSTAHYRPATGIDLGNEQYRNAESNLA